MLPIRKYSVLIINLLFYGILFLLIIFLPSFVWDGLINPTQTGKFIVFSYAVILLFLLFILRQLFFKNELTIKFNIIDVLLAIVLLYITVNRYFIQPIYGFSMNYLELIGLAALYIILRSLKKEVYPYLFLAVIVSGIIQAAYGNLQLWDYYPSHHSGFKMTGSFFNPGPYAGFLASVFPVALGVYLFKNSVFRVQSLPPQAGLKLNIRRLRFGALNPKPLLFEYLSIIGIVSILLVIPASRSRAAWLAVLVSLGFLLIMRYRKDIKQKLSLVIDKGFKRALTGFIIIMLFGVSLFGMYKMKQGSADGRLLIWQATSNIIKDYPLFGVGFDRFKAHYMNYQADFFQANPESEYVMAAGDVNYAFNEPLQFLAEQGMAGLAIILILMYLLVRRADLRNSFQMICWAGAPSILAFSLFSYPAEILPIKMNLILMLAVLVNTSKSNEYTCPLELFRKIRILNYSIKTMSVGCLLTMAIIAGKQLKQLRKGYKQWRNAFTTYQMGAYEASLEGYESIYTLFERNGEFLQHYGKALSLAEKHEKAIKVLEDSRQYYNTTIIQTTLGDSYQAIDTYIKAEEAYKYAYDMIPNRFYPKYLLAKLYDKTGQQEKAVGAAKELLAKKIKIKSTAIEEIKVEMKELLEKYSNTSSS